MTVPLVQKPLVVLLMALLALSAAGCGQPAALSPEQVSEADQNRPAQASPSISPAAGTAQDPQAAAPPESRPDPIGVSLSTPTLGSSPETKSPDGSPTATAPCDQAAPGIPFDVTIPDDTQFEPGEAFTKVWRLYNVGTCAWTREYSLGFFSGDAMDGPQQVFLAREVPPGSSVDLEVELAAPEQAGKFQGNWKLRNANQEWFGIGPGGSAPFWVRVIVVPVESEEEGILAEAEPPAPSPTAMIAARGAVSLALDSGLDLDFFPQTEPGGEDLRYQLDTQGQAVLAPVGSALVWVFGVTAPEIGDCLASSPAQGELVIGEAPPGAYLCYRTNLGLPGWMQVLSASGPEVSAAAGAAPTETPEPAASGATPTSAPGTDATSEPGSPEPSATPSPTESPVATEPPSQPSGSLDLEIFTWSIP